MNHSKVSIVLINPKSPDNVGSVMRAAGNYRVDSVYYTGQRYPRALALNPDTPNLSRQFSASVSVSAIDDFSDEIPIDCKIVCVEFAENAQSLPEFQHPEHACYVFGPEDGNIPQEIIDGANDVVYVPTRGCMNLAATVNVLLYDRLSKSHDDFHSNQLIKESRDTNNNLKVKPA